ncbi:MAG: hypothetical protein NVSMB45_00600 [Ginsengibacter sp.]
MKKVAFVFCFCFFVTSLISQTLFSYGKYKVSKQAFLKAYHKNNSTGISNDVADYLNLYINYKLKLQEARDLQMDTLPSQKTDLQNFANQISANYLIDSAELIRLAKEAITRSFYELHLTYIFIPKDKLNEIKFPGLPSIPLSKQFNRIKLTYPNAVYEDASFITVFSLPYKLENRAYALSLNQISKSYDNGDGIYYFQVIEKRPALVDKIQTAQILIAVEPSNINDKIAKRKADSLYELVKSGADFALVAMQASEDKSTASNGGMMEEFGISKYSKEFNDPVFRIKKVNEISKPFKTRYGYHIVKLISKTPVKSSFEESNLAKWKQRVMEDDRISLAKEKMINKVSKLIKLPPDSKVGKTAIMDYYRKHLIDYNNSFKEVLNEYEEGNLVFELMNQNVWQKGARDSTGLFQFYTLNKNKYDSRKKFDDIKGKVINDYEIYLENLMVDRIKIKYPITINKAVFHLLR